MTSGKNTTSAHSLDEDIFTGVSILIMLFAGACMLLNIFNLILLHTIRSQPIMFSVIINLQLICGGYLLYATASMANVIVHFIDGDLFLTTPMPWTVYRTVDWICQYLQLFAYILSINFTLFLTVQKCFVVCDPIRAARVFNTKTVAAGATAVLGFSMFLVNPLFYSYVYNYELQDKGSEKLYVFNRNRKLVAEIYDEIYVLFVIGIMCAFNAYGWLKLRNYKAETRRRCQLMNVKPTAREILPASRLAQSLLLIMIFFGSFAVLGQSIKHLIRLYIGPRSAFLFDNFQLLALFTLSPMCFWLALPLGKMNRNLIPSASRGEDRGSRTSRRSKRSMGSVNLRKDSDLSYSYNVTTAKPQALLFKAAILSMEDSVDSGEQDEDDTSEIISYLSQ